MLSPAFEYIMFPDEASDLQIETLKDLEYLLKEEYNLLFQADNLLVLKVLKDIGVKIDLIYIDPPYFAGSDEKIDVDLNSALNTGNSIETEYFTTLNRLAYLNRKPPTDSPDVLKYCGILKEEYDCGVLNDNKVFDFITQIWPNIPLEARHFCNWFYYRVKFMKELLSNRGIIAVRFDYHYGHYAKLVLDSVFGHDHFIGEFMIRRMEKNVSDKSRGRQNQLNVANDSLFVYFHKEMSLSLKYPEKRRHLVENEKDNKDLYEHLQIWLDPKNNVWMDIAGYEKRKKTFYPTENSVELLERIIECFSNEGSIVSDFFAGSGVTFSVASEKGRRWIGVDIGEIANIQTIQRLKTQGISKFVWVRNTDRLERLQNQNPEIKVDKTNDLITLKLNYNEFLSQESITKITKKDKKMRIISQSSIIEYTLFQDKNIEIFHFFTDHTNNNQPDSFVKSPQLQLTFQDGFLTLDFYKIIDTTLSEYSIHHIQRYEYLVEYMMILIPKENSKWICKSADFGKILTTKKKRDAPNWNFFVSEDMYCNLIDKEGKSRKGILLEICDITGLKFKVLYTRGELHD